MLTTNRKDPALTKVKENGQNEAYLILSDEERAKGFVRPYRDRYIHAGRLLNYKGIHKILTEQEQKESFENSERLFPKKYVAVMTVLTNEDGSFKGGTYVTQEELDAWKEGKRFGGCGVLTKMNQSIAETYAREPKFYSATFCIGCGGHLPVNEFLWDDTNEEVGS